MRDLQVKGHLKATAHKQKGQAANVAYAQKSFDILKANPELIQAFQAAATGGSENAGLTANKPFGTSIMGENLNRESEEPKKETTSPSDKQGDVKKNGVVTGREDKAPVGSGTDLASLDSKKHKM
ncbi:hypothetical protein IFM89_033060, partial [Coptis chinensis]